VKLDTLRREKTGKRTKGMSYRVNMGGVIAGWAGAGITSCAQTSLVIRSVSTKVLLGAEGSMGSRCRQGVWQGKSRGREESFGRIEGVLRLRDSGALGRNIGFNGLQVLFNGTGAVQRCRGW